MRALSPASLAHLCLPAYGLQWKCADCRSSTHQPADKLQLLTCSVEGCSGSGAGCVGAAFKSFLVIFPAYLSSGGRRAALSDSFCALWAGPRQERQSHGGCLLTARSRAPRGGAATALREGARQGAGLWLRQVRWGVARLAPTVPSVLFPSCCFGKN